MVITAVQVHRLRSLHDLRVPLGLGLTGVHGPNGAGKTNLLEAIYFALTGRSFRTSDRRELIPFGEALARTEVVIADRHGMTSTFMAAVSRTEGRRHMLDGKPVDPSTAARHRPHVLVFSPDRLAIVKGPPSERRAHIDAFVEALRPHLSGLRRRYGQALAQRNAILSRVAAGQASRLDIATWDRALAREAVPLVEARASAVQTLTIPFAEIGTEIGLEGEVGIDYRPRASGTEEDIAGELAERVDSDLRARRTGWGPHLDEIAIELDGRSLRRYGSQGQQRAALLALLFAERAALEAIHATPLMLLDDVMSELDPARRESLGARLAGGGQSLITAADRGALPLDHLAATIELDGGEVR